MDMLILGEELDLLLALMDMSSITWIYVWELHLYFPSQAD
jgi:hypothetical protein